MECCGIRAKDISKSRKLNLLMINFGIRFKFYNLTDY